MHMLLRSASAVVIILGLSAGAVADAKADVAYSGFGEWFNALVSGDHNGRPSPRVGRCADPYNGCNDDNGSTGRGRDDRSDGAAATDRGAHAGNGRSSPAENGGGSGNTGGSTGGGNTGGGGGGGYNGGGGGGGGGGDTGGGGYNGHGNNGHGNNVGGSDPSNPGKGQGGPNRDKGDGRADHESPGHQGGKRGKGQG